MWGFLLKTVFGAVGKSVVSKGLGVANAIGGGGIVMLAVIGYIVKAKYTITLEHMDIVMILAMLWVYVTVNRRAQQPPAQKKYNPYE